MKRLPLSFEPSQRRVELWVLVDRNPLFMTYQLVSTEDLPVQSLIITYHWFYRSLTTAIVISWVGFVVVAVYMLLFIICLILYLIFFIFWFHLFVHYSIAYGMFHLFSIG